MDNRAKILLADDDHEDMFIITSAFKEIGHETEIECVDNGEKVLSYLDAVTEKETLPALIILDLNMPRLSGTETLRTVKQIPRYKHIPVVIFSTSVNEREKDECLRLGAAGYITKPVKYLESLEIAQKFYNYSILENPAEIFDTDLL